MTNIHANWSSPPNVHALTTLRNTGHSKLTFASNNLALHVGDDPSHVRLNREQLKTELNLPTDPEWLEQVHGNTCIIVEEDTNRTADAAITRSAQHTLAIMTADCLPILLCSQRGDEVAAIHAGWRGLANGVIENTVSKMLSHPSQLIGWIGPAICQDCFEVGADVLTAFQNSHAYTPEAFRAKGDKWHANLPKLAEYMLNSLGIMSVYQSNLCTFEQKNDFYSYRRESQTGRMATLIWFNEKNRNI
ncbi:MULTISPECIES: peptidoglycan editing factor PgeF [unclassified Legionella]|uniref:peptidoglycan editing factor PgeF n=1 Tax=unclassified Legionella TaxID=2622702 RepID=UPI0010545432|nr:MULTISPECIES: peptidoglycan editing factor PgeF [unclassified Legionella]MDI9818255.1 peptidoglycan editing factor PgeF [Legionella sp. PL877]